jgi:drug/metabolite transporter (DMT)-like permease
MSLLGELAALSTALLWSFTAIFFSEAGKRIGSYFVNKIRLVFAALIYGVILFALTGVPWPSGLNGEQVFWLTLSGLIGLVFGDGCGFKSLVMIGPRLATLVMASAPIITTLIAWFFLGETLKLIDLIGIMITLGGIAWVVLERQNNGTNLKHDHPDSGTLVKGVLLAFGAAIGQAGGLVLSKKGMLDAGGTVNPLTASAVRVMTAVVIIWGFSAFRGTVGQTIHAAKNKKAVLYSLAGAFAGPFLGVWMSLVAVANIKAGIAATLNATTPVLIIPTLIFVYHEKITWRAVVGAVVAISGVALLFLG